MKNRYIEASVAALVGAAVYAVAKYLLAQELEWLSVLFFFAFFWAAYFLGQSFRRRGGEGRE